MRKFEKVAAVVGTTAAIAATAYVAVPAIATAASPTPTPSGSAGAPAGPGSRHAGAEAPLSGTVAAKVRAAVLAKLPGATVDRTSAEDPAEGTGAAYEAHVTKSDGTHVEVLLDKNVTVTRVSADMRGGRHGGGFGREAQLSGTVAAKVRAAVLAKLPGATVDRTSAEDPAEGTGAAYEAHVTKSDGTHVEVLLDKNFQVTKVTAGGRFDGHGGWGGPPPGTGPSPGSTRNGSWPTGQQDSGALTA